MHDAVAVGVVQSAAGLGDDVDRLPDLEVPAVAQQLRAGAARDVLHHDEVLVVAGVKAEVEDLDDVGVDEPRGGERLPAKARHERRIVGQMLGQQLEGHIALETAVEGQVDRRHAADAETALDPVSPGDRRRTSHHPLPPLPLVPPLPAVPVPPPSPAPPLLDEAELEEAVELVWGAVPVPVALELLELLLLLVVVDDEGLVDVLVVVEVLVVGLTVEVVTLDVATVGVQLWASWLIVDARRAATGTWCDRDIRPDLARGSCPRPRSC